MPKSFMIARFSRESVAVVSDAPETSHKQAY